MASRFILPFADVGSGITPFDGAQLFFFDTGTSTPKDTFSDEQLTPGQENTNPVISNSIGIFSDIWMGDNERFKVVLKDKNDVQQWEADPVTGEIDFTPIKIFDNVADMAASTDLSIGDTVKTLGYFTAGDGGGNDYEIVAAATGTDDGGSFIDLSTHQAKGLFDGAWTSVEKFGAKGDGTTDDALAFQATSDLSGIKGILLAADKTYKLTNEWVLSANQTIDLNGSTIRFDLDGAVTCLYTKSGCTVKNGTVENNGVNFAGSGNSQCPIVIGEFSAFETNFVNVTIENLTIISNRPNGNGIFVTSSSRNVRIINIDFPSSANLGRAILCHWGAAGAAASGTFHPSNILIENINIADLTFSASTCNAIFISACSDVVIRNVRANLVSNGAVIFLFAGDYGFQYGTAFEQQYGAGGIKIDNVVGTAPFILQTNMKNTFDVIKVQPSVIHVRNIAGTSSDNTTAINAGLRLQNVTGLVAEDCDFFDFRNGVYLDDGIINLTVKGGNIRNCTREGFYSVLADVSLLKIQDISFSANNSLNVASTADIRVDKAVNVKILRNTFDSPLCTWSVRISGGANSAFDVQIIGNDSLDVDATAGPVYSIGGTSDVGICTAYRDNSAAVIPTNGIRGGQLNVPAFIGAQNGSAPSANVAIYQGKNAPTAGTYGLGDIVLKTNPTAGGKAGFICTTAGTPGTWKTWGSITA